MGLHDEHQRAIRDADMPSGLPDKERTALIGRIRKNAVSLGKVLYNTAVRVSKSAAALASGT